MTDVRSSVTNISKQLDKVVEGNFSDDQAINDLRVALQTRLKLMKENKGVFDEKTVFYSCLRWGSLVSLLDAVIRYKTTKDENSRKYLTEICQQYEQPVCMAVLVLTGEMSASGKVEDDEDNW